MKRKATATHAAVRKPRAGKDAREETNHEEGHGESNLGGGCEHLNRVPYRGSEDNVRRRCEQSNRQIDRRNGDEADKKQSETSPRCPSDEDRRDDNQGTFRKTVKELTENKGGSEDDSRWKRPRETIPQHETIRDRVHGEVRQRKGEQAGRTSAPPGPQEIGDGETREDACSGCCGWKGGRRQDPEGDIADKDIRSRVGDPQEEDHASQGRQGRRLPITNFRSSGVQEKCSRGHERKSESD